MEVKINEPDVPPKCFVCNVANVLIGRVSDKNMFRVECARCGKYVTSGQMLKDAELTSKPDIAPYLPAYIRQANLRGTTPEILSTNWEELARSHSNTPVMEKASMMLKMIAGRSSHAGDSVEVDAKVDYPLIDARSWEEASFVVQFLEERGYVSGASTMGGGWSGQVEMAGWSELQSVSSNAGRPGHCFVALWFDPSMDEACELGFKQAIRECGLEPIVIRDVHFNDDVCDRILAELRLADFVVADFTGNRGGVYFEAGFAKGLGRKVIFTCREDYMKKVHFDTNHYSHITWKTPDDLRQKLVNRIRATILDGK